MIFLLCPQYKIRRFYVKDKKEKLCLVQVTTDHVVVPVYERDSLEDFDLGTLPLLPGVFLKRESQKPKTILIQNYIS